MFHQRTSERGQALILIAFAAIGLFAFSALAIDGSRQFSNKRHAQNAADTAVMTAALKVIRTNGNYTLAETDARTRASSNGYTNNWGDTIVDVDRCVLSEIIDLHPTTGDPVPGDVKLNADGTLQRDLSGNFIPAPCEGVEAGKEAEYLRVKIVSTIPTTFGRVIGRDTLTTAVESIARVQGSSATGSFPKDALVALTEVGCGICGGGNPKLTVEGSGIFSNSADICDPPQKGSIEFLGGNGTVTSQGGYTTAPGGKTCWNEYQTSVVGEKREGTKITNFSIDVLAPNISCAGLPVDPAKQKTAGVGGAPDTYVYPPGTYTKTLSPSEDGINILQNGPYCLEKGISFTGGSTVVITNISIKMTGGDFSSTSTGRLTCTGMFVHGAPGSAGVKINGGNPNICTGVTFYLEAGDLTINGNANSNFAAPTSGPYQGLLVYMPDNDKPVKINGNANNTFTGSIIAPKSEVEIAGNEETAAFNVQIIGDHVKLTGNSETKIKYDPALLFKPPANPTIEFTK